MISRWLIQTAGCALVGIGFHSALVAFGASLLMSAVAMAIEQQAAKSRWVLREILRELRKNGGSS